MTHRYNTGCSVYSNIKKQVFTVIECVEKEQEKWYTGRSFRTPLYRLRSPLKDQNLSSGWERGNFDIFLTEGSIRMLEKPDKNIDE